MIVVTGAAGLIGSAIVRELNKRGREDIILVDHLATSEKWKNLRSLRYYDYFEKDDFINYIEKQGNHTDIKTIFHLGACSATTEKNASYLIENNYRYSVKLAEFALYQNARLVYASSAATYGEGENGFDDDIDKLETLRPLNMYGYSKQMFDQYLKRRGFPENMIGVKYYNVYGPNEYHKGDMMSVVLKAFRQIKTEGTIQLFKSYRPDYKDGEQMRDFLYVEDAARMTVFLGLDAKNIGGLFNAGSGKARTWLDLAKAIFFAMGLEPSIRFIEMPEALRGKYQYYTCAPIERLRAAGYNQPVTGLEDAVKEYVTEYLMKDERIA